jgi:hypothetical protein
MTWQFETLGNAMVQVTRGGEPLLVTDPWLSGDAYFGSWDLERPLSEEQLAHARGSKFVWFSHGHPDHFHVPSVESLPRTANILLPDHYDHEIRRTLVELGFAPTVLPQKTWVTLDDGLRVLCVANENMDAILAIDVGGTLLLDKNDSPFCGEDRFFRKLVSQFERSYMLSLCAFDADMINTFDHDMRPLIDPPEDRKPGTVWATAKVAEYLGVQNYCCSSSQHVYARPDSAWANGYRITWPDMRRLWTADAVRLVPPFSQVALPGGAIVKTHCEDVRDPETRIVSERNEDWTVPLSEEEWNKVERFSRQFETLRRWQDFIGFNVGGETRIFQLRGGQLDKPQDKRVGVIFHVPRGSLLETTTYGYFDDLLIGNFMKTQLFNMRLYPLFTPRVAKLGGNAKVFTARDLCRFRLHYFRTSPLAFLRYRAQLILQYFIVPAIREQARALGLFLILKDLKRRFVGAPRTS